MGACLSCIYGGDNEDDINETTSLLDNRNVYYNKNIQEEQLLKQQKRQQELNNIVNEMSSNLIDVSTFLSNSNSNTPNLSASLTGGSSIEFDRQPTVLSKEEQEAILKEIDDLDDEVKEACKVESTGPLYLKF